MAARFLFENPPLGVPIRERQAQSLQIGIAREDLGFYAGDLASASFDLILDSRRRSRSAQAQLRRFWDASWTPEEGFKRSDGCKSLETWSGRRDLNPGPLAPQAKNINHLQTAPNENKILGTARFGRQMDARTRPRAIWTPVGLLIRAKPLTMKRSTSFNRAAESRGLCIQASFLQCVDRIPDQAFESLNLRFPLGNSCVLSSPLSDQRP